MTKRFFAFSSAALTSQVSWLDASHALRRRSSKLRVPRRKVTVEKTFAPPAAAALAGGLRLAAAGLLLLDVAEQERPPAVPEDDAAVAEDLIRDEAVAAVAVVLEVGAVHAVVVPVALVVGDQV